MESRNNVSLSTESTWTFDKGTLPGVQESPARMTQPIRYHFDFDAKLPDSLFKLDAAENPEKSRLEK